MSHISAGITTGLEESEPSSIVIDDFTSSSPLDRYSGDTDGFSVVDSPSYNGMPSLTTSSGSTIHSIGQGLNYPSAGDTIEYYVYGESGAEPEFLFGVQDGSNLYALELVMSNGRYGFEKTINNSDTGIDEGGVSLDTNTWYRVVIDWGADGEIGIDIINTTNEENLLSIVNTDTEFSSGGVGWDGDGSTWYISNLTKS